MSQYAVSHINFMDHELETEFVHAETWQEALAASKWSEDFAEFEGTTLEEAKVYAFDMDCMIEIALVPHR